MNHDSYDDSYIRTILQETKSVAVVGASSNKVRPSYFVVKYLLGKGYDVIPVNPGQAGQDLLGQLVVPDLDAIDRQIDMVDIFRNAEAALAITRDAIRLKDKLGIKTVWMQLGVRNDVAAAEAEAAGLQVVMNRCPKIEYGRLCGEIGWAGVNSRTLSSKRGTLASGRMQNRLLRD